MSINNEKFRAEKITPDDAHYFYGYYDNQAWNKSGTYHLCHRVKFMDRLPKEDDVAELGMIDLRTKRFIPLAETTAWNFQQGSMLQWHPKYPDDEIIFNSRNGGKYEGVVMNVHTGERRRLERPVANVDPTGKYALNVSFSRMFDFRPGYGYAGIQDPFFHEAHPDEDGIFQIDLSTGKSKLIISLKQIWDLTKSFFSGNSDKILINHITFNTDGSRFVFLVRNFPKPGNRWQTAVMTANADGSRIFQLTGYDYASHYHWRDTKRLAIYAREKHGDQLYELKDRTKEVAVIDEQFFKRDGHCSYSPNRRWMLYDSYPDQNHYRHLFIYDLQKKKGFTLGSYYSDPKIAGDIRCDLHPRWNRSGTAISFDSIHEGHRGIYLIDLRDLTTAGLGGDSQ